MTMNAARLEHLREHDLIDLGAYLDEAKPQMAAQPINWGWNRRDHLLVRPVSWNGLMVIETLRLFSEGLN